MERQKMKYYILLIAVIMGLSLLLPLVIRAVTDLIVEQIIQEDTLQTETGITSESETGKEGRMSVTIDLTKEAAIAKEAIQKATLDHPETEAAEKEFIKTGDEIQRTGEEISAMDDMLQAEKLDYDQNLAYYHQLSDPEFTETQEGALQQFISGREDAFTAAISDYVYSLYGDSLTVTKVDVVEFVKEDDTEATYQIQVFARNGKKEYSECFISTYNKKHGFYSIYAYEKM